VKVEIGNVAQRLVEPLHGGLETLAAVPGDRGSKGGGSENGRDVINNGALKHPHGKIGVVLIYGVELLTERYETDRVQKSAWQLAQIINAFDTHIWMRLWIFERGR